MQGYSQNPDGTLNYNSPVWNCGGTLLYGDGSAVVTSDPNACGCGTGTLGTISGYDPNGNPICNCTNVPSSQNLWNILLNLFNGNNIVPGVPDGVFIAVGLILLLLFVGVFAVLV